LWPGPRYGGRETSTWRGRLAAWPRGPRQVDLVADPVEDEREGFLGGQVVVEVIDVGDGRLLGHAGTPGVGRTDDTD